MGVREVHLQRLVHNVKQRKNLIKQKIWKSWIVSICRTVFLISFSFVLLYPILYMISTALKTSIDYIDPTVVWVPKSLNFDSFVKAYKALKYPTSLLNTVRYELVSAVIEVFSCAVFAYGLARFKFRAKKIYMFFLILTIFVPDIMLIIPRVINFKQLDILGILGLLNRLTGIDLRPNIVDTVFTFYLPSIFGVGLKSGLFIFIYMQFFKGLPHELEEAAWIDGAGPFKTFLRVILPSSGVVLLTVFIFSIIWHWNDYLLALMYTNENRPMAVIVQDIKQYIYLAFGLDVNDIRNFGVPLAACLLFISPPLILYMFLQRKFIQSIDRVGIVG